MESPVHDSDALSSLSCTIVFAEPAFNLAYAGPKLYRSVYRALQEFNIEPPGLQESKPNAGPADWQLSVSFLSFTGALKLRVDSFEVTFIGESVREIGTQKRVLDAVEGAVLLSDSDAAPYQRTFVLQRHWKPADQRGRMNIPFHVGSLPEILGTPTGQGIGLYFANPLSSGETQVVFDKSVVFSGGLFAQVRCNFDADEFDLMTSTDNFHSYLRHLQQAFELPGKLGGTE